MGVQRQDLNNLCTILMLEDPAICVQFKTKTNYEAVEESLRQRSDGFGHVLGRQSNQPENQEND